MDDKLLIRQTHVQKMRRPKTRELTCSQLRPQDQAKDHQHALQTRPDGKDNSQYQTRLRGNTHATRCRKLYQALQKARQCATSKGSRRRCGKDENRAHRLPTQDGLGQA